MKFPISYIDIYIYNIVSNGAQIVRTANEMSSTDNAAPTNKSFNN